MNETCTMLRGDVPCGAPAVVSVKSAGETCHFCEDCAKWGATCEIHTTVDDTDEGGPYDFTPCDKPATQNIQWTTPGGTTLTLGVCAFHATGEL